MITLLQAMEDPNLFGKWFSDPSWDAWKVFISALFASSIGETSSVHHDIHQLYQNCTGRRLFPREQAREAYAICGRRAGKSHIAALLTVFKACFCDYSKVLSPGERVTCMILSTDRQQSRVVMRYVKGLLESVPMLANMIENVTREAVDLSNNVTIEVHTCSYRSVRGYSLACCVLDELAYWRSDDGSTSPAEEVLASIRPATLSIPGSLILGISSLYSRHGVLWDSYRKHWGRYGNTLIWRASTETMNPGIDTSLIAQAYEDDQPRAAAEFGAEFRTDLELFISREAIDACVTPGRYELPRQPNVAYSGFLDSSGGSSDAFTVAVAHRDGDSVVIDALRERVSPFSPDEVCREYSELLKSYGVTACYGDKYAGEWPRERMRVHNIEYRPAERTTSELYLELLPVINAGRIELLDHPKSLNQLCSLERRTSRAGKDAISHPPGAHDDLCAVIAGAAYLARVKQPIDVDGIVFGEPWPHDPAAQLTQLGSDIDFPRLQDF